MKKLRSLLATAFFALTFGYGVLHAQTIEAVAKASVDIPKGATPSRLRADLKRQLEVRSARNLIEKSFSVRITPDVEGKIADLAEQLSGFVQIDYALEGDKLEGTATIRAPTARVRELLSNLGIGAGDMARQAARIMVSLDEALGVATFNDAATATETQVSYSHDKSRFSDTSVAASSSGARSQSESSSNRNDVSLSANRSVATSGSSSSSTAARQDSAFSGQRNVAVASEGYGGSAAGASSTRVAGAQSTQLATAQRSQFSGAASSSTNFQDRSQSASASSSSSSESASIDQKNVQRQNDRVNLTVTTRMPDFNNAKTRAGAGFVTAKLGGVFIKNGMQLVDEGDLRAEGGRILTIDEIIRNGRRDQFVDRIRSRGAADVWATGQVEINVIGTKGDRTECSGKLRVQGTWVGTQKGELFTDALNAEASGRGDQNCRDNLGAALAESLARVLSDEANKALNARASRGNVFTIYLYSINSLSRGDRNKFLEALRSIPGVQISEPRIEDKSMAISFQFGGGSLDATINKVLDQAGWRDADYVGGADKYCVGLEGKGSCPAVLR
jgi:hypothetical protein